MQYAVKAIHRMQPVSITVDAADGADARRQAESRGYAVLAVQPASGNSRFSFNRTAPFPLLHFNQSLLILLKAGLSVVEAIETLADRETRADAKQVLVKLHDQLKEGKAFSTALEAQPAVFPPLYVASVRANERTGALTEAIERFIVYRAQSDQMRKRIVGAAVYPAMILGVGTLVIAFLLLYVVPRFSQVFQDMGDRIPLMSRLLLEWGQFAHAHGLQLLAGGVVLVVGLVYTLNRPQVRMALARQPARDVGGHGALADPALGVGHDDHRHRMSPFTLSGYVSGAPGRTASRLTTATQPSTACQTRSSTPGPTSSSSWPIRASNNRA